MISLLLVRVYPKAIVQPKSVLAPPPKITVASFQQSQSQNQNPPNSILIPSIDLSLPVSPAIIANNQWTLYDDKVSWLATSNLPGTGNVILYAHNRKGLFGDLNKLEPGDKITVEAGPNKYTYQVKEKRAISPHDVDALLSSENQLTLYTCDGSFDEKRLIVTAVPLTEQLSGVILK